ncbi:hypothetical protein ANAEL_05149 [Anaerolineales bacterium]|nr:hypothetical protein ANAEL_05149 [Anaerolineales bacterium]
MESIVFVIFLFVLGFWLFRPVQHATRISRKPKHKQYDEDRYADYFMKRVSEVYNLKARPKEPSEDEEDEGKVELENNIEFEEKEDPSPTWSKQQLQYDLYEIEDIEARSKSFDTLSQILEIVGILWLCGIIFAEANFPSAKSILADKTLFILIIKVFPALLLIVAIIARILGIKSKPPGDRALAIFRGVFLLLLGIGYVINQLSGFLSNSK